MPKPILPQTPPPEAPLALLPVADASGEVVVSDAEDDRLEPEREREEGEGEEGTTRVVGETDVEKPENPDALELAMGEVGVGRNETVLSGSVERPEMDPVGLGAEVESVPIVMVVDTSPEPESVGPVEAVEKEDVAEGLGEANEPVIPSNWKKGEKAA